MPIVRRHPITLLLVLLLLGSGCVMSQPGGKDVRFYNGNGSDVMMWQLFYNDNMSGTLVRLRNMPMDSLPDDINLVLVKDTSEFCFPVKNVRTSPYGWRWNRPHRGVDIALHMGDPVRACFGGVVRIARPMGDYGNLVVIRHENGLETVYGHLSRILVKPRQIVKAGDVIGLGGSTGRSTGPHLHFEVRFQYEPFDPEWILDFSNYTLRTRRLHLDKTYFGISPPRGNKPPSFKADRSIIKERPPRQKPKEIYYEVKRGDTLSKIAEMHQTTKDHLKELNPGIGRLQPGQRIRVR